MTDLPDRATVLDTSVLSNFAHVDRLDVLVDLPRVVTVEAVRKELQEGTETHGYLERAVAVLEDEIPVATPAPPTADVEAKLLETLDPGEAGVLAVAEATNGLAVTDDGDARTVAERRGTAVTGSIGLLVRFVENGEMAEATADEYLTRWIDEAEFRSPAREFGVFLRE